MVFLRLLASLSFVIGVILIPIIRIFPVFYTSSYNDNLHSHSEGMVLGNDTPAADIHRLDTDHLLVLVCAESCRTPHMVLCMQSLFYFLEITANIISSHNSPLEKIL